MRQVKRSCVHEDKRDHVATNPPIGPLKSTPPSIALFLSHYGVGKELRIKDHPAIVDVTNEEDDNKMTNLDDTFEHNIDSGKSTPVHVDDREIEPLPSNNVESNATIHMDDIDNDEIGHFNEHDI